MPNLCMSERPRTPQAQQRAVHAASAVLFAVGLFWISKAFVVDGKFRFGNPVAESGPEALSPIAVRAEVTRVSDGQVVRPGQRCDFLVQQKLRQDGSYECNAQVMCGSKLLFGGPERGYFPCRITEGLRRDVVGLDPSTSRRDSDPAFKIDTHLGVLSLWDDETGELGAFRLEAEILSVN
jgi:hypothetical protein